MLVTVGTTEFDDLVRAVDDDKVLRRLGDMGFGRVLFQIGKGEYTPRSPVSAALLTVEFYRFKPNLKADMAEAQLIITHAGAGSIMVRCCERNFLF